MKAFSEKISLAQKYLETVQHAIHHHFRGMSARKESKRWQSFDDANNQEYCKKESVKWANWSKEHFLERDEYMIKARTLRNKIKGEML